MGKCQPARAVFLRGGVCVTNEVLNGEVQWYAKSTRKRRGISLIRQRQVRLDYMLLKNAWRSSLESRDCKRLSLVTCESGGT